MSRLTRVVAALSVISFVLAFSFACKTETVKYVSELDEEIPAETQSNSAINDYGNGILYLHDLGDYANYAQALSDYETQNPGWEMRSLVSLNCGMGYTCAVIADFDLKR